jgi:hypothetical protein
MATVAQIIDQAARRLNELSTTAPVHWTRAELLVYLNDAVNELNLISGEIQSTVTIALTAADNVYTNPVTVIAPLSVRVNDHYLHKESVSELDNEADWEAATANRRDPKDWAPLGTNLMIIYPRPLAAATAYVEAFVSHTPAVDGAGTLEIRQEYEIAIEDYIISRAMFKEGGAEFHQAEQWYSMFADEVRHLTGLNILRRYPAFDVAPELEVSEVSPRETAEAGGKK